MRPNKILLAMFTLATCLNLGLLWLYYMPSAKQLVGDERYYFQLASAIARGEPAQHSALFPPLYAELLGRLFALAGPHRLAAQLLQVALWLASAAMLYQISARLFQSRAVSHIAVALFLFSPELSAFAHYLWPETLHMALWLGALYLLICRRRGPAVMLLSGLLLGLALLTKSLLLPFIPVLLLWVALQPEPEPALGARLRGTALLSVALLIPIVLGLQAGRRDQRQAALGGSALVNLWIGLTDVELVDYRNDRAGREIAAFRALERGRSDLGALYRAKIAALIERQGPAETLRAQLSRQYFRLFDHQTFFTTQLPGGPREAYRFDQPLLAAALRLLSHLSYAILLIGGALGLALVRPRRWGWAQLLLLFIAYNLGLFGLLHVKTRYTLQLLPFLSLLAGAALYGLRSLMLRQPAALPEMAFTRPRWVAGALLALLMALLMFRSAF